MLIKTPKMVQCLKKKGAIGIFTIAPEKFLDLTSNKWRKKIEKEALEIEDYNHFITTGKIDCMPYIKILPNGKIVGHEGRHRGFAIRAAGGKKMEVGLIIVKKNPKATGKKDKFLPIKLNIHDVPIMWKAQFSDEVRSVNLKSFSPF